MRSLLVFLLRTTLNIASYIAPRQAGKLALLIFGTPRKGQLRPRDREILSDAEYTVLDNGNLPIAAYHWPGEYGPILLIHGWESNSARWKKMIEHLRKRRFGVVAIDGPAHGGSGGRQFSAIQYAQMIDVAVRHYKPEAIVGHSVGGMATAYFLSRYRHQIQAAAFLGAPDDFTTIARAYQQILGFNDRVYKAMQRAISERYHIDADRFQTSVFVQDIEGVKGLVIHDKKDNVTDFAGSERTAANWSGAEFIGTSGYGHSMNHRDVNAKVSAFLIRHLIGEAAVV